MLRFFAHFLFLLAAWTLVIKFILPIVWAIHEGATIQTYIYWDFWWAAHLWLGWALLTQHKFAWPGAVIISAVEILIIVTKFWLFLLDPQWTLWTMNWFVNKLFVLTCFLALLGHALARKKAYFA